MGCGMVRKKSDAQTTINPPSATRIPGPINLPKNINLKPVNRTNLGTIHEVRSYLEVSCALE